MDDHQPQQEQRPKRKGWFFGVVIIILLGLLFCGGYVIYNSIFKVNRLEKRISQLESSIEDFIDCVHDNNDEVILTEEWERCEIKYFGSSMLPTLPKLPSLPKL